MPVYVSLSSLPLQHSHPTFTAITAAAAAANCYTVTLREVGSMDTHHHTVSLRVKSVLDSCGGADELNGRDDDMQELEASQQVITLQAAAELFLLTLRLRKQT